MTYDKDRILNEVISIFGTVLGLDRDSISENSRPLLDLGAEMLDYHFICRHFENRYNIKLFRGRLLRKATFYLKRNIFESKEKITRQGAHLLQVRVPECEDSIKPGMHVDEILKHFTIGAITNRILQGLNEPDKSGEELYEEWLLNYKKKYLD